MKRVWKRRSANPLESSPRSAADDAIVAAVRPYTMTSDERIEALLHAVAYLERRRIPGAYAECGVWRGGSALAMMLKLIDLGVTDRHVWLYDTFEGMPEPTERDTSSFAPPPLEEWRRAAARGERAWPEFFAAERFDLAGVRELLRGSGYPEQLVHVVAGRVEDTLPVQAPDALALLRLDTDWYESTRHELEQLYPRLAVGGVLMIDDYGHWDGCRRAVDEYFERQPLLLHRVDYTGRIAVKV